VKAGPKNAEFAARDLAVVWHPCTQMQDHERLPLVPIARGQGVWLYDFEGRRYLDAISSWWVNLFGHANPRINAAVKAQVERLEHVLIAGFTHQPVLELSESLVKIVPAGLTRCFFADNGSAAVEVAVKMSFHYWQNLGRTQKRRFVTLSNSYHGETLGALAVGDVELYKQVYKPLLMDVITVPSPDCHAREPGESWESHSRRMFAAMEATLAQHADEVAAVIVEPLVQCAGSMRMYHPLPHACARPATATACCSSRTRSRSASAAPARCSPASRLASARISCACRRGSPAATCHCPSWSRPKPCTRRSTTTT
jgi:adenosylmethionine-8-amino-7-oxononanoate aminotransferase